VADISIIVPAYRAGRYVQRCLEAIYSQETNEEIIIVDNGSEKAAIRHFLNKYPEVVFIENKENRGTSFARNQALRRAKGDWIVFMDADSYIGEGFLPKLKKIISSLSSDIGSFSPKILKNESTIFSCGLFLSSLYRSYNIAAGQKSQKYKDKFEILGPNTCCGVYRRRALEQIAKEGKVFDEEFFFLWEDFDIALRLKKAGFKSLFVPELVCFHKGGSAPIERMQRRYFHFSGRLRLIKKNYKGKRRFFFFLRSFVYDFLRSLHFFIFNPYRHQAFRDILSIMRK